MSIHRRALPVVLKVLALFLATTSLLAQPDRLTSEIHDGKVVALRGGVPAKAQPQYDQGLVEPSLKINHITLLLRSSVEQQQALSELQTEQQDRFSPNYHKWLTPEQFANRFGLSRGDIEKITSWLQAQGFNMDYVARGRMWVAFSGTAEQVQRAFRVEIHHYNLDNETHFANSAEPSVPAALADVVIGIRGLDDFYPKNPRARAGSTLRDPSPPISPRPADINGSGVQHLSPDDVATIYDINALYNAGFDGSGQTLVVVGTGSHGACQAL